MDTATFLGIARTANTSLHRTLAEAPRALQEHTAFPVKISFLINIQKPTARRAQLFCTHLLDHILLGISRDPGPQH